MGVSSHTLIVENPYFRKKYVSADLIIFNLYLYYFDLGVHYMLMATFSALFTESLSHAVKFAAL